ncbi:MAG: hypothetical protein AABY10_04650 [Nanoarchaeota archaeon]
MHVARLDGIKYSGRFEGELVRGKDTFSNSEAPDFEYEAETYHYEGFGLIKKTGGFPNGGEFLFRFETSSKRRTKDLGDCVLDLIGGQLSSVNLGSVEGRETFLHIIYQHLRETKRASITPLFINCRSIPPISIGNRSAEMREVFAY